MWVGFIALFVISTLNYMSLCYETFGLSVVRHIDIKKRLHLYLCLCHDVHLTRLSLCQYSTFLLHPQLPLTPLGRNAYGAPRVQSNMHPSLTECTRAATVLCTTTMFPVKSLDAKCPAILSIALYTSILGDVRE